VSLNDLTAFFLAYESFRGALRRELEMDPSSRLLELAERLREVVEERSSLDASLGRSVAANPLSKLQVPFAGRQEEFGVLVTEHHVVRAGDTRVVAVLEEGG
jgi:hypothetical protein